MNTNATTKGLHDTKFLDELFPQDHGKNHYLLRFYKKEDGMAEIKSESALTWRELVDMAIEWCLNNGVCVSYLAEQGLLQEGYQGRAYMLPDEAKIYIAGRIWEPMPDAAFVPGYKRLSDYWTVAPNSVRLIVAERMRQIGDLKFGAERDDKYLLGELVTAAECYTDPVFRSPEDKAPVGWPWPDHTWTSEGVTDNLIRAGALLLAEQDRLNRAAGGTWSIGAEDLQRRIHDLCTKLDEELQKQ